MARSLDEIRERFPHLGLALYAFDPGAPVTLEIHTPDGAVHTAVGPTVSAAIDIAFPTAPEPELPETPVNVFD